MKNKLEVIEAEAADELDQLKARIVEYDREFHSAFQRQMGYAFLAGCALLRAEEIVPHGKFLPWCEAELSIKRTSSLRYRKFAEALRKLPTVGNLKEVKLLEEGAFLTHAQQAKVTEAVHDLADGKSLTEMYRDLGVIRQPEKAGGAQTITFHCAECSADLTGKLGKKVTCECGRAQKAAPDRLSPAEQLAANKAHSLDLADAVRGPIRVFLGVLHAEDGGLLLDHADWQSLLDIGVELTTACRARLKEEDAPAKHKKGAHR